jgi:hypothetical protein
MGKNEKLMEEDPLPEDFEWGYFLERISTHTKISGYIHP